MPLAIVSLGSVGCSDGGHSSPTQTTTVVKEVPPSAVSEEWVNFHIEVPYAAGDFHGLASGLFGTDAQSGKFAANTEVSPGVFLSAVADPSTPQQTIVSLTYNDGSTTARPLAVVPASFAVGNVYLTTIDAAIAAMQQQGAGGGTFLLQYQVTSTQGGTFSFGVHAVNGVFTLVLDVSSPTTSLMPGNVGKPVSNTAPYDTINGTVWFTLTQDDFDYFVGHAYGADATAGQNFNDFELGSYDWLRLTVTPHLDQQYVNVSFAVLGNDGNRTPFANAPASILAGNTFQTLVDHAMSTMTAQEALKAGSSSPWTIPFYYSDPAGGGVVQVIAQGQAGVFNIAYAVSAPNNTLQDVSFLPYKPVTVKAAPSSATTACNNLGNKGIVLATEGAFDVTFTASPEVKSAAKGPLVATLWCSVFNATDVTADGPVAGAHSFQDFSVPNADLSGNSPPTFLTQAFPDGDYQILCFQDLAGDGNADAGDPVTLPIGSFPLACNLNPINVQFAVLNPTNH
ncbi:MAG TPA: hypothetical protein VGG39_31550 [Polyangiaceae bacterium]